MSDVDTTNEKREWVQPELKRLEAGAAESGFSGNPDSSSPQAS